MSKKKPTDWSKVQQRAKDNVKIRKVSIEVVSKCMLAYALWKKCGTGTFVSWVEKFAI